MAGVHVPRRSLNSVTQDLAPLMTIEDDDDDVDEGVIMSRPSVTSPISPPPPECHGNSSSLDRSEPTPSKTVVPTASSCLKWTLGLLLIIAGLVLNTSTPIYTLVMSEKSDIYIMNLITTFWTAFLFLAIWIAQCLCFSKSGDADSDDGDQRRRLYFRPKYASFKTLAFLAIINTVVNILISFAMLPSRTPKALQAILASGSVVSATVFRKLILDRGVSVRRVICLGAVMLGLFVAAEPEIFDLPMTKIIHDGGVGSRDVIAWRGNGTIRSSFFSGLPSYKYGLVSKGADPPFTPVSNSIFWTVILLLSNVPAGLAWVLYEREASRRPREVFLINFYAQLGSLFLLAALFWIDLAPGFGQADSIGDFWRRFENGVLCHYLPSSLSRSHCGEALVVSFACISSFAAFLSLQVLLMALAEGGSTFSIIVSYLSVPASSIFWLLFDFRLDGGFVWAPLISFTSLFPVLGFTIMVPAIILFNLIGVWETRVTFDY